MRGYRPSRLRYIGGYARGHAWLVAWVLLASLLSAHAGLAGLPGLVGQGLHAVAGACAGEHVGGCDDAGDCHDEPEGGCQERCPGDAPDGTCPPQCDDCRCCAGASVVLVPGLHGVSLPVQVAFVLPPSSDRVMFTTHQRIFRPPRPVTDC